MTDESRPSAHYVAITKSDTVPIDADSLPCRAIYVGGAGNFVAVSESGDVVTFTAALAGHVYPVSAIRINSTSTTATAMVALY
jgi:hypothetical protein